MSIRNKMMKRRQMIAKRKEGIKLEPVLDSTGYLKVKLFDKNNIGTWHFVHKLVADTFLPNPNNKVNLRHINGNKQDNRVENLEWID
jgi:hypothetical protein